MLLLLPFAQTEKPLYVWVWTLAIASRAPFSIIKRIATFNETYFCFSCSRVLSTTIQLFNQLAHSNLTLIITSISFVHSICWSAAVRMHLSVTVCARARSRVYKKFEFYINWQIMNANGYTTRLLHLLHVLTCLRKVHDTNKSAVNKEYEFSKTKTKIVCEENHTKNCMCCALDLNQHLERKKMNERIGLKWNGSKKIPLSWLIWQWGLHSQLFSALLLRFSALVLFIVLFGCAKACVCFTEHNTSIDYMCAMCMCVPFGMRSNYIHFTHNII